MDQEQNDDSVSNMLKLKPKKKESGLSMLVPRRNRPV
jgi:hypothetical protein